MTSPIFLLFGDLARRLRWRGAVLVAVMIANGLTTGVTAALLFPLLSTLGVGKGPASGNPFIATIFRVLGPAPSLSRMVLIIVVAMVLQSTVAFLEGWLAAHIRTSYIARWRIDLFKAMFDARWQFFTDRKIGQLLNTLLHETTRLNTACVLISMVGAGAVFIAMYLGVAIAASWRVALGIGALGVVMSLGIRPLVHRAQRLGLRGTQLNESMHVLLTEFLSGAKVIKATASEDRTAGISTQLIRKTQMVERQAAFNPILVRFIYEISAGLVLGASLWIGSSAFGVDSAAILTIIFIFMRIYMRLADVQQNLQHLHSTYAHAIVPLTRTLAEARAELEQEAAPAGSPGVLPAGADGIDIRLRNVSVHYGDRAALDDVSLDIPSGTVVGIVGPSGAGKSTLVDAILALVPISGGAIEIGDLRLDALPAREWRHAVGYVAQDTFLFNASIADNIRWGNPTASDEEIRDAARRAHAEEFIDALPQAYATEIGDRGARLSGGQRQRIGLARALVGKARLLILDEATSALDSESERAVLEAIYELRGRITVIMVAHRLSTLRAADSLCLIDDGHLVESGRWEELTRPGTRFSDYWRLQSEGGQEAPQTGTAVG